MTRIAKKNGNSTERAFEQIKEAFELVAQDEARTVSFVPESCSKALTTCGASSHHSEDREESQCPIYARIATASLERTTFGGSLGGKGSNKWWCAFCGENTTGSNQTGSCLCKQEKVLIRLRYSKRMQYLRDFVQI